MESEKKFWLLCHGRLLFITGFFIIFVSVTLYFLYIRITMFITTIVMVLTLFFIFIGLIIVFYKFVYSMLYSRIKDSHLTLMDFDLVPNQIKAKRGIRNILLNIFQ